MDYQLEYSLQPEWNNQNGNKQHPKGGYSNQEDFNRLAVGEPIGIFMGYVFDGVYMTEEEFNSQPKHASSEIGTVRMKDVSGLTVFLTV